MKKRIWLAGAFISISLLAACSGFPLNMQQNASATPTAMVEIPATATPSENTPESALENKPQVLRIWLPPQFDPSAETPAGEILRERLATFAKRRPDLILDVRIKAASGQNSLLSSLLATQNAAPTIMPDLVALSRPDLEAAALRGILHPFDGLSDLLDDPDWFPYARSLAHIQNSAYGLPFSANLFGLAYRSKDENSPAQPNLTSLSEEHRQILFSADNPQANFSFCLYSAAGAPLRDEQGVPSIDVNELTNLLTFYQSESIARKSSEIGNNETLWEVFNAQPEFATVVWTKDFLEKMPANTQIVPIPTPSGGRCALATAWTWALAGSSPDLQPAAVELAEYLSDSEFLSAWTAALGSLPPRPTALDPNEASLHALSLAAQPIPSNDIAAALGEVFRVAAISVLRDQVDPGTAAQNALAGIQ